MTIYHHKNGFGYSLCGRPGHIAPSDSEVNCDVCIKIRRGADTLYMQGTNKQGETAWRSLRGTSDVERDAHLIDRALDFRYAAIRQKKVLVIDFVPRWKAVILKLLGVELCEEPK